MYSKTRNTLTALIAASLLVAAGWLFGHPISAAASPLGSAPLHASMTDIGPQVAETLASRPHRANRMNLAMPYYSFALLIPQSRAN
jgi:phosphate/sulfate permease